MKKAFCALLITLLLAGCNTSQAHGPAPLEAGYRYSSYGPTSNPGAEYWPEVGQRIASEFENATPATIWIVGVVDGEGSYLNFPCETDDPNIHCGPVDMNESMLTTFDEQGFDVWLQVEAGNADMDELIDIVLGQYEHHPSVVGFGVDVEWYKSSQVPQGEPVSDEVAQAWVRAIRNHHPEYQLFLKHWDTAWMPPTARDGILFINDSQGFESFEQMTTEFTEWGKTFAPARVGFQYGYQADQRWWSEMQNPASEIGHVLLEKIPNTQALFWVDFTILETFPPE
ncbi:MAG TPA: membrane lipoprotein lipid attachment site-containing protein [Anaerolineales bacterium]|nr:membrane lipoprotein lipid attachment site-containing protein [Anaerolineales bacterium]HNJ15104.1 membrane lipoprotein lipid attachment site-containing protein [Anaerolineales bacterium]